MTNEKTTGLIGVRDELFETYKDEIDLPVSTFITADEILDDAVTENLTRNRCYRTVIASIVLLACRKENIPRVAADIAEVTPDGGSEITGNRILNESLKLKRELGIKAMPADPDAYFDYFADQLDASPETRSTGQELLQVADEHGISNGPAPPSIAAGVLDAARRITDDDFLQSDISDVSNISVAQLRKYCQEVMNAESVQQKASA